jgi:hypothetical protein
VVVLMIGLLRFFFSLKRQRGWAKPVRTGLLRRSAVP